MIFKQGQLGIEFIIYKYAFDDAFQSREDIAPTDDDLLENMIIYHGMDIKGQATMRTNLPVYRKSFTHNDKMHYITLGDIVIIFDTDKNAEAVYKIINGILSHPKADEALETLISDAKELFFQ